jgi:hypothetical protein
MHRQTLARSEKVLGAGHPDTLMSVYSLAHLLANRHRYDESLILYKRACAGYGIILGEDHSTTRACRQHYSETLMSQKQDQPAARPTMLSRDASIDTVKRSKLSRGLAKMGIKRSIL